MDDNTRSVLIVLLTTLSTLGVGWMKSRETRKYLTELRKTDKDVSHEEKISDADKLMDDE